MIYSESAAKITLRPALAVTPEALHCQLARALAVQERCREGSELIQARLSYVHNIDNF